MIGHTMFMELRTSWKGILVISLLVLIVGWGMVSIFPTFQESLTEDLEGADNVDLVIPEDESGELNISWVPVKNADGYIVLENDRFSFDFLLTSKLVYMGTSTNISIPYNSTETKYYAIMALENWSVIGGQSINVTVPYNFTDINFYEAMNQINTSGMIQFVGLDTTGKAANLFEELMENPGYSGFTGGRVIDMTEIDGFLSLELFSWLWILVGMFMAYFSVSSVTSDFEGKRMDLIFSTPISREQYIIEKFLAMTAVSLIMIFICAWGVISGLNGIGEIDNLDSGTAFLSIFTMLSFLMIIAAFGIFLAVVFRSSKAGMGINIAFVFGSFILLTISGFADSLRWLKYISIMHYWDYNSMLLDGVFNTGYFLGLLVASLIILGLAIYIFKKRDIPM
ncbi:MAG: ABC transporter permease subunit [Thermoplasmata archaeon]|nr:MAG: ABC transporter permease subunit [Thermoplasmata archaeon]